MSDIIVIDRDRSFAHALGSMISGCCGRAVQVFDRPQKALQQLLDQAFDAVVLGVYVDEDESAEIVPTLHQIDPKLPIVAVGDRESLDLERRIREMGIFYYIVRPVETEEIQKVIERAVSIRGSADEHSD